jgi:hypothetical protein
MFRMIPAVVAVAAASTFSLPLSAQTQAQPATPPASTAPTVAGQPPSQPPAATPIVPPSTASAPATAVPTASRSLADTEFGTAIVLLERVQKVLDDAAGKTGNVTLDRGVLDELRAEVTQARLTLKGGKP